VAESVPTRAAREPAAPAPSMAASPVPTLPGMKLRSRNEESTTGRFSGPAAAFLQFLQPSDAWRDSASPPPPQLLESSHVAIRGDTWRQVARSLRVPSTPPEKPWKFQGFLVLWPRVGDPLARGSPSRLTALHEY
jgi:hypothetical protein